MGLAQPSRVESQVRSEGELLAAVRAGEPEAYEQLVRAHSPRMLAVARRYLRHEEDARDAVQDAFLKAHRALPDFRGDSRLSTWLHRIVVNSALMRLRTRRRRPETPIGALLPRFLEDGRQAEPARSWEEPGEAAFLRRELREHVRSCVDQLPDSYRSVLVLRDLDELDTRTTARLLGLSVPAVKTRLHRARQALRTLLDPFMRGETPPAAVASGRS